MKKTILITSLMALMCGAVFAQPAGDQAGQEVAVPAVEAAQAPKSINDAISSYIAEANLAPGLNNNGFYISSGIAAINVKPSDKKFEDARALAYQSAMSEAKKSIANFYGQQISTYLEQSYMEPASADHQRKEAEINAAIDPGVLEKCKQLLDAKINKELKKEGISYDSPKAKDIIKDMVYSKSIKDSIHRVSYQTISGLILAKNFENLEEIGVVVYYSPASLALAKSMNQGGDTPKTEKREGKSIYQWHVGLDKETLYMMQGVHLTGDEDGNLVLISYGQSIPNSSSAQTKIAAKNKAELEANKNLRRFAGESIIANEGMEKFSNSIELENNETVNDIEKSYFSKIEQKAEALNIPGILPIHTWEYVHPQSKQLVCGSVCIWSIKTGNIAIKERNRVINAGTPGAGFTGTPEKTPTPEKPENKVLYDNSIKEGRGSDFR